MIGLNIRHQKGAAGLARQCYPLERPTVGQRCPAGHPHGQLEIGIRVDGESGRQVRGDGGWLGLERDGNRPAARRPIGVGGLDCVGARDGGLHAGDDQAGACLSQDGAAAFVPLVGDGYHLAGRAGGESQCLTEADGGVDGLEDEGGRILHGDARGPGCHTSSGADGRQLVEARLVELDAGQGQALACRPRERGPVEGPLVSAGDQAGDQGRENGGVALGHDAVGWLGGDGWRDDDGQTGCQACIRPVRIGHHHTVITGVGGLDRRDREGGIGGAGDGRVVQRPTVCHGGPPLDGDGKVCGESLCDGQRHRLHDDERWK